MRFESLRSSLGPCALAMLLLLLLGGPGCGGLGGFDIELPPVIEIDARLEADPAELQALIDTYRAQPVHPESHSASGGVFATILWVTAPHVPADCETPPVAQTGACPPPTFVAPYEASEATTYTPTSSIRLRSQNLPPLRAGADVGSDRVTFGAAILFLDTNGDEQYDPWDRVLAASWFDDALSHTRIAVREGNDPALSLAQYYPPPVACPALPRGVSLMRWDGEPQRCQIEPAESTVVPMGLLTPEAEAHVQCGWNTLVSFTLEPSFYLEGEAAAEMEGAICVSPQTLLLPRLEDVVYGFYQTSDAQGDPRVVMGGRVCPQFLRVSLRGCYSVGGVCDHPDWDYTNNPPEWWPC